MDVHDGRKKAIKSSEITLNSDAPQTVPKTITMSLKSQAVSGIKWTTLSTIVTTIVQFLQLFILARLLRPEDFGLMAMVTVIIGFAQAYADLGVSAAIVQRNDATPFELSSLYWLNVISGVLLFTLMCAISPLVASFFHEPLVKPLMVLVSLSFIITPFGTQFQMLLQKHLFFDYLARLDMITSIFGMLIISILAWNGYGVWALVWGALLSTLLGTALLIQIGWRQWPPMFHFKLIDIKGYLSFGLYQMGERTINYFNSRVDQLLIGYLLGAQALGYYSFAFNLVMQPQMRINPILTRVAFPIFSKVQNDIERLQRGYLQLIKMLCITNAPLLFGMVVIAPLAVPIIFGNQWIPAIGVVQILSIYTFIRSIGNPVGSLLLANGRADLGFKWNFALFLFLPPIIFAGANIGGIIGICIALLGLQIIVSFPAYWFLIRPLIGSCAKDYFLAIMKPVSLAVVMAFGVWALSLMSQYSFLMLVIEILAGGILYLLLLWVFDRQFLSDIIALAR